jgi:hypothetical protein
MKYLLGFFLLAATSSLLVWSQMEPNKSSLQTPGDARSELPNDQIESFGVSTLATDSTKNNPTKIDLTKTGLYTPVADTHLSAIANWQEDDTTVEPPVIRQDVPNLTLFGYHRDQFIQLTPGDTVDLALPAPGNTARIWVDKVIKNPSGSLTVNGKVDGHPDYSFVMTLGEESVSATIGTADGVFNLRGNKSHAWIGLGRSFNHHVNPETPDYRVVKPEQQMESNS